MYNYIYAFIHNPKNICITPNTIEATKSVLTSSVGFINPGILTASPKNDPYIKPITIVGILKNKKNLAKSSFFLFNFKNLFYYKISQN